MSTSTTIPYPYIPPKETGTATFAQDITNDSFSVTKSGRICCLNGSIIIDSGKVKAGYDATVLTLPTGFRPTINTYITVYATYSNTSGVFRFRIKSDGDIVTSAGSNTFSGAIHFNNTFII